MQNNNNDLKNDIYESPEKFRFRLRDNLSSVNYVFKKEFSIRRDAEMDYGASRPDKAKALKEKKRQERELQKKLDEAREMRERCEKLAEDAFFMDFIARNPYRSAGDLRSKGVEEPTDGIELLASILGGNVMQFVQYQSLKHTAVGGDNDDMSRPLSAEEKDILRHYDAGLTPGNLSGKEAENLKYAIEHRQKLEESKKLPQDSKSVAAAGVAVAAVGAHSLKNKSSNGVVESADSLDDSANEHPYGRALKEMGIHLDPQQVDASVASIRGYIDRRIDHLEDGLRQIRSDISLGMQENSAAEAPFDAEARKSGAPSLAEAVASGARKSFERYATGMSEDDITPFTDPLKRK